MGILSHLSLLICKESYIKFTTVSENSKSMDKKNITENGKNIFPTLKHCHMSGSNSLQNILNFVIFSISQICSLNISNFLNYIQQASNLVAY